ncbi:MAG: PilZ domain-containing protein [Gemmataceae bacterium]|nr:PilZ domain-containing protein [Gemmataceae bacterium]
MSATLQSTERRARRRYRCRIPASYDAGASGKDRVWWWGRVRDFSRDGLHLTIAQSLAPGTPITISLCVPNAEQATVLTGRVVHASAADDTGQCSVGCKFHQELGEAEFQLLRETAAGVKGVWTQSE